MKNIKMTCHSIISMPNFECKKKKKSSTKDAYLLQKYFTYHFNLDAPSISTCFKNI